MESQREQELEKILADPKLNDPFRTELQEELDAIREIQGIAPASEAEARRRLVNGGRMNDNLTTNEIVFGISDAVLGTLRDIFDNGDSVFEALRKSNRLVYLGGLILILGLLQSFFVTKK